MLEIIRDYYFFITQKTKTSLDLALRVI